LLASLASKGWNAPFYRNQEIKVQVLERKRERSACFASPIKCKAGQQRVNIDGSLSVLEGHENRRRDAKLFAKVVWLDVAFLLNQIQVPFRGYNATGK